ncbi:LOW QUALITY PROTEIN: hypothetical protein Dda_1263 [Drechslerella dactyloides]|uniref:DNA ligase n=1 Tax=Drechslerella dactyloides TaxID=74499 RepID=A0AAD6J5Y4_DREDA|nr:LOW QUALITY PROTEIN: hypothetical protein Dda_1263 [Drechslerella dactyloides]
MAEGRAPRSGWAAGGRRRARATPPNRQRQHHITFHGQPASCHATAFSNYRDDGANQNKDAHVQTDARVNASDWTMPESPAKRRKKNDKSGSPTKGPTLDFFFGRKPPPASKLKHASSAQQPDDDGGLTDEQLARKLQAQWAKEDAQLSKQTDHDDTPLSSQPPEAQEAQDREFASKLQQADEDDEEVKKTPGFSDEAVLADDGALSFTPAVVTPSASGNAVQLANKPEWDNLVDELPFDKDPLSFSPEDYQPLVAGLPDGKLTYGLLTRAFVLINSTRSRIKIVDTLTNFLRTVIACDPASLLPAVWLTTNDIGPPYEQTELGIGGSIISKALLKVGGLDQKGLRALYNKYGDAGDAAFEAKVKQRTLQLRKPVPLRSQETKQRIVERLLVQARGEEVRYLARTLVQHLRIGAVKTTMLIALSRAFLTTHPPNAPKAAPNTTTALAKLSKEARTEIYAAAEEILKACFARCPNYNEIVTGLLSVGLAGLKDVCKLTVHTPLKPMLGSITRDLPEMLGRLGSREFTAEYKYDGQRAQIHCDEHGKVSIFSRHLENMTDKYPDLVALIPSIRGPNVATFIMEGEVVAIDGATGSIKTFQTLASRGRKDVAIGAVQVDVCMFAFDLMQLNGEELLARPFRERRRLLREEFVEVDRRFTWVKSLDATADEQDAVLEFFRGSLQQKCEGVMVKLLDNEGSQAADDGDVDMLSEGKSNGKGKAVAKGKEVKKGARRKPLLATYEPDKRLESWLKVKKDYDASTDTLDVIPIAAWHGMGRKSKWWSPVLLAVRNPETGALEAVCKCMSGFTDAFYQSMKDKYAESSDNTTPTKKPYIEAPADMHPKVWFEPQEVWEIVFADVTLSPNYTAAIGLVSEERGLSLRFPRFLRVRNDKTIDEASTSDDLARMYRLQMSTSGGKVVNAVDDGGDMEFED